MFWLKVVKVSLQHIIRLKGLSFKTFTTVIAVSGLLKKRLLETLTKPSVG